MKLFDFNRAQFSEQDARKIRQLIDSPEMLAKLNEIDQANVARRIELKEQLDSLDGRHDPAIESALKNDREAIAKVESLREQLRAAEEAQQKTATALFGARGQKDREFFTVRKELVDSRDLRGDQFLIHLGAAHDSLRHVVRFWFETDGRNWLGHQRIVERCNAADVDAVMDSVKQSLKTVEDMALEPLTHGEITERLNAISSELGPRLKEFLVPWPFIDEEGQVRLETNFTRDREVTVHRPGSINFKRENRAMQKAKRNAELDRLAK
ncbi:hypothetical protein WM04_06900 [Burkholderia ubonensis]|uniref:hypothetical protein n=1 Tax=Burkholderia ubonensis TaxID=101571 RepID=UPI0007588119|nr:hypothetical protein [Burkholderia ubonensis]KWI36359.1 hypothetical protein WM04_06900 [Burkholderia ubonensis]OJB15533.1 hypothetical protein BGV53_20120 [Burkholderia ubonensis]